MELCDLTDMLAELNISIGEFGKCVENAIIKAFNFFDMVYESLEEYVKSMRRQNISVKVRHNTPYKLSKYNAPVAIRKHLPYMKRCF
ncbi:MAG: hypothetical protein R3Y12_04185 [Clostridia bacterium]